MLAQLTAFELLLLVLVVGFISALAGWAGGAGARLLFAIRLDRVEGVVLQILNRSKGAAGQAVAAKQRERSSSAEKEAEELARKLAAAPRRSSRLAMFGSPADAAEAASFAEIEAEQAKRRKGGDGGVEP